MSLPFPELSADEAAALIGDGSVVGLGGFTPAGAPKAIPKALAQRALREHAAGRPFGLSVISGSSTGQSVDGELARARALNFRAPYQANADLRAAINSSATRFVDMDLSRVPQAARRGWFGKMDWAIIEAASLTPAGEVLLTSGVGAAQTYCALADRVLIELNARHPAALEGIHDLAEIPTAPRRREIPIYSASDRIGAPLLALDPKKIARVVRTDCDDEMYPFEAPQAVNLAIGRHVAEFLAAELKSSELPAAFLPLQAGIGDVANAVLLSLGENTALPRFQLYAEVIQSTAIQLLKSGRIASASGSAFAVMPTVLREIYADLDFFKSRTVLRPQEISNCGEVIQRLGVIAINTALEIDLCGNINSSHVLGQDMVNGIGGSGDFARNAHLSIFTTPSESRDRRISRIVPLVSHTDHTEHAVHVVVTEHGCADLRGKCPRDRARLIVENCAHPDYRPALRDYLKLSAGGHTPQTLRAAFALHEHFRLTGDMRGVDFSKF